MAPRILNEGSINNPQGQARDKTRATSTAHREDIVAMSLRTMDHTVADVDAAQEGHQPAPPAALRRPCPRPMAGCVPGASRCVTILARTAPRPAFAASAICSSHAVLKVRARAVVRTLRLALHVAALWAGGGRVCYTIHYTATLLCRRCRTHCCLWTSRSAAVVWYALCYCRRSRHRFFCAALAAVVAGPGSVGRCLLYTGTPSKAPTIRSTVRCAAGRCLLLAALLRVGRGGRVRPRRFGVSHVHQNQLLQGCRRSGSANKRLFRLPCCRLST